MSIWLHNDIGPIVLAFKSGSRRALTVFVCKAFVMQIGEIAEKPPPFESCCHTYCHQKSVNLQYITLGCLDDGTNESLTKSLMFQVCIFFFYTFYRLKALKTLYFYCCNFIKKIYLEHQTLGRRLVCPIVQATQRIIL